MNTAPNDCGTEVTGMLKEETQSSPMVVPNKRKRRPPLDKAPYQEVEQIRKSRNPKKKQQLDTETEFDTVWICVECKEAECIMNPDATQLLICDGSCRRVFHYPCAGLENLPSEEEDFICEDCASNRHTCAICSNYGIDNQSVFKCSKSNCGLFFHLSCLAMQEVDVDNSGTAAECYDTEDIEMAIVAASSADVKVRFVCPAHSCWTCTQTDLKERETNESINSSARGGKGKKKNKPSSFETKTERFMTRCLECPIAYHISCIPPSAKFHELATLCHEHSTCCKLPDLDPEASIQQAIEQKVDQKFDHFVDRRKRRAAAARASTKNPFFRDLVGDKLTTKEKELQEVMRHGEQLDSNSFGIGCSEQWLLSSFCLPCDLKDEVHSKPPQYNHVQSLQYHQDHKPPRVPPSSGVCSCVDQCDENCLNRMLYTECFGDTTKVDNKNKRNGGGNSKKNFNCLLGPSCGNRQMGQRLAAKCKPIREQGKGWGLCTIKPAKKGDLIQEYVGEVIDAATKEARLNQWSREHPNDPNFYMMALQPGWFIDARGVANLARFINHACEPNCSLTQINVSGRMRCGIFAMRDIEAGEFLSYDYKFDTRNGAQFVCRCGSLMCRGTMKSGSAMQQESAPKNKKEIWEEAKASFERDKKFLADFHADRERRRTQVDAVIPGGGDGSGKDELVSNGPQIKHRENVRCNRIFLWRNVVLGDNFSVRFAKLPPSLFDE